MFSMFPETHINLCTDRVPRRDGERQTETAIEIIRRFERQPGVVLADEVGMGKTFVAMAVAAAIILEHRAKGPVVVMVPSSLKEKWPKDWAVFCEKCLTRDVRDVMRSRAADSGMSLLRLLDDKPDSRANIIFLTHGALHRALDDGFAKLAVIKRAFKGRPSLRAQRNNFERFAARLLRMSGKVERLAPQLLGTLLELPYDAWLRTIHRAHEELKSQITDDPVPRHLADALDHLNPVQVEALADALRALPRRESKYVDDRLRAVRQELSRLMSGIWKELLRKADFRSSLLILDEAHHVKNPGTRLASLFVDDEAAKESQFFESGGALGGKFDRMLFLTATPFQLGHNELINILNRFEGIDWTSKNRPQIDRATFKAELRDLAAALDDSQSAALRLDNGWGRLKPDHMEDENGAEQSPESWWDSVKHRTDDEGVIGQVVRQVIATRNAMKFAETRLRPWVIRSIKAKEFSDAPEMLRRKILPGAAISDLPPERGIEINGKVLLPFLLAGRAQMILAASKHGRALFADGLSSSFEAYFETREGQADIEDEDGQIAESEGQSDDVQWYLRQMDESLRTDGRMLADQHPKVHATAKRVLGLWQQGEKVLVFCHYRATGRALRQHISTLINEDVMSRGKTMRGDLPIPELEAELDRVGNRFEREGRVRDRIDAALKSIVAPHEKELEPGQGDRIVEVMRRFVRTPSFLVRYIDIAQRDLGAAFEIAIERTDLGGLSLRARLDDFCQFLARRCIAEERQEYLDALESIQTGSYYGREVTKVFDKAERRTTGHRGRVALLPNVRLANGEVRRETRRKLLLAFNAPLFPEVLIASSVLAEGVDLHLNCRFVIHHDLCWNPSTLEQRTGRVDRIGSKAEKVKESICVYLPYIAATQDEKMFRVVRDRERWFQILMGDKYELDESATEARAERIPLPDSVQSELTLKLQPGVISESGEGGSGCQSTEGS